MKKVLPFNLKTKIDSEMQGHGLTFVRSYTYYRGFKFVNVPYKRYTNLVF